MRRTPCAGCSLRLRNQGGEYGLENLPNEGNPYNGRMQTSYGAILIELDAEKAPKTVANFLAYVKDGHSTTARCSTA